MMILPEKMLFFGGRYTRHHGEASYRGSPVFRLSLPNSHHQQQSLPL